jgi:hypothetical protein
MNGLINKICYLCGKEIDFENDKTSPDHVPPKQFYPESFRAKNNPKLFTLKVHDSCNKAYQKDEDYFFHSIGPLAHGSMAGNLVRLDLKKRFACHPHSRTLGEKILKEFIKRPSNIVLPNNLIGKTYDAERINRIIWKIIRGLFFKYYNRYLPMSNQHVCEIYQVLYEPPDEYLVTIHSNMINEYPEVIIYGHTSFCKNKVPIDMIENIKQDFNEVFSWAILLWQRIPIQCTFFV